MRRTSHPVGAGFRAATIQAAALMLSMVLAPSGAQIASAQDRSRDAKDLEPAVNTSASPPPSALEPAVDTSKAPPPSVLPPVDTSASDSASGAPGDAVDQSQSKGKGRRASAQNAKAGARAASGKAQDRLELDTTQITGNRELPKVLYIVPWKRSDLGDLLGKPVNSLLDEVLQPVDRDVFKRENRYFTALDSGDAQGASGAQPAGNAPGNAAQPATGPSAQGASSAPR